MVRGTELARELAAANAFDAWRGPEALPGQARASDAEIEDFVRHAAGTYYHPVGTCRMGVGPDAVVDPSLRVRGIRRAARRRRVGHAVDRLGQHEHGGHDHRRERRRSRPSDHPRPGLAGPDRPQRPALEYRGGRRHRSPSHHTGGRRAGAGDTGSPRTGISERPAKTIALVRVGGEGAMRRTPDGRTHDDRGSGSSILRVLADTPRPGWRRSCAGSRRSSWRGRTIRGRTTSPSCECGSWSNAAGAGSRRSRSCTPRPVSLRCGVSTRRWRASSTVPTTSSTPTSPT